jgi:hypothetical protein
LSEITEMAFSPVNHRLGLPSSMAQIDTTDAFTPNAGTATHARFPIGTVIRAVDPTLGEGEFIYLKGVANLAVGLVVSYNATTGAVTLLPSTANLGTPVAVSMSANTSALDYSWYQISGLATVLKSAVAVSPQAKVYISGTTGRLMPTSASGKQILGAKFANLTTVTSTTSTVTVLLARPTTQGQIT